MNKKNFLLFLNEKQITQEIAEDMFHFYLKNNPIQTDFTIFIECLKHYSGNFKNYVEQRLIDFEIKILKDRNGQILQYL